MFLDEAFAETVCELEGFARPVEAPLMHADETRDQQRLDLELLKFSVGQLNTHQSYPFLPLRHPALLAIDRTLRLLLALVPPLRMGFL